MPETWGFGLFLILAGASVINVIGKVTPLTFLIIGGSFAVGAVTFIINLLSIGEKESEAEFGEGEFERMVANLDDGIISYDNNFRIAVFNKAAEGMFHIKKDSILGKSVSPELISDPNIKLLVQIIFPSLAPSVLKKSAPGVFPQVADVDFSDPDFHITVSTDRVIDSAGKTIGFFKIIRNRTREVDLLRSKSEFVSVAAHQLRTPITAVHWIFEILSKNESVKGTDAEMVASGLNASLRMLKIVNDLLDVSRIEAGRFGYNFMDIDISAFLSEVVANAKIVAKEFSVSISLDMPSGPIMIHCDPQKLGLAFSNLIDNAIKYNLKNGQVFIRLAPVPNAPYIDIAIRDTGIGVPPNDMQKLFTKFYRGENVVKEQTDGSGLGLYITKNIIARHGGKITAESVIGRGTTFNVHLPLDPTLIPSGEVPILD